MLVFQGGKKVLHKLLRIPYHLRLFVSFCESSDWDWMKYTRCERLLLVKAFFCFWYCCCLFVTWKLPREIEDNGYAKFWGVNKVHYCLGDNGELPSIPHKIRIGAALFANTTLSARVFRLFLLFRWFYASSPRAPSSFRCRRRAFFQFWLLWRINHRSWVGCD